jgi:hypothetical protein
MKLRAEQCVERIAKAADNLWQVGKAWAQHPDSFSWEMKSLSGRLHGVRREFEDGRELRSMAETACPKIQKISDDVRGYARHVGGKDGEQIVEAYEILAGLVNDLKAVK